MKTEFQVGQYRAISLWGGRGARQMLRLRFPGMTVDNPGYDMACTEEGVERVRAMGFNTVILMASWGFPPEAAEPDWEVFRRAVRLYQQAEIAVVGGIQVASCVAQGSYRERDWYALDPWGKPVPLHTGRLYTCWNAPEWLDEVRQTIHTVIDSGATGLLFALPWSGGGAGDTAPRGTGAAVCYDARCRSAYHEASGESRIPLALDRRDPRTQRYWQWRDDLIARRLGEWASEARALKPDLALLLLDDGQGPGEPTLPPGLGAAAAQIGAALLVPGVLPQVDAEGRVQQNAARAGVGQVHPGHPALLGHVGAFRQALDAERPGGRFVRALAESSALHLTPVLNGSAIVQHGSLTLLIQSQFAGAQQAIREMNGWLEQQAPWLNGRRNSSPLAVCWPGEVEPHQWGSAAPFFWSACLALIRHGLPFRVVGQGAAWDGVTTLIMPPGAAEGLDRRLEEFAGRGGRVVALQRARPGAEGRPLWPNYRAQAGAWWQRPLVRRLYYRAEVALRRWYYTRASVRSVAHRLGQGRAALSDEGFVPAAPELLRELADAARGPGIPYVEAEDPLLLTLWQEPGGAEQWHLVNYRDAPQRVTVHAPEFVSGWVFAPEEAKEIKIFGHDLIVTVEDYKVLRLAQRTPLPGPEKTIAGDVPGD